MTGQPFWGGDILDTGQPFHAGPALMADTVVWSEVIHKGHPVAEHLPDLPLCWVAEAKGATVEEWEITFDQAIDGEGGLTFILADDSAKVMVNCRECREWMSA